MLVRDNFLSFVNAEISGIAVHKLIVFSDELGRNTHIVNIG